MSLKDYIYYRLYVNYVKGEGSGRFAAIYYFVITELFLVGPFLFFFDKIFQLSERIFNIIVCLLIVIIFVYNFKRYNKQKIEQLKKKYRSNPYNKSIPAWVFYFPGWLSIIWFLVGIVQASKLAAWILS